MRMNEGMEMPRNRQESGSEGIETIEELAVGDPVSFVNVSVDREEDARYSGTVEKVVQKGASVYIKLEDGDILETSPVKSITPNTNLNHGKGWVVKTQNTLYFLKKLG